VKSHSKRTENFSLPWKKNENTATFVQKWQIFIFFKIRFTLLEWDSHWRSEISISFLKWGPTLIWHSKKRIEISLFWSESYFKRVNLILKRMKSLLHKNGRIFTLFSRQAKSSEITPRNLDSMEMLNLIKWLCFFFIVIFVFKSHAWMCALIVREKYLVFEIIITYYYNYDYYCYNINNNYNHMF